MRKDREHRPVNQGFEDILAEYDIFYQQYYTMSLVGEHIHRLLTNSAEICRNTKALMLLSIPEGSPGAEAKRLKVTTFMGHMLELMDTLDYLCAVMHKTDIQSETAIDEFEMVAMYFGQIYRSHFNRKGTPKLHVLEVHAVEDLRRHKRLGLFDESQVEREHHTNKVYCLLFRNMKSWFKMHRAIDERFHRGNVTAVLEVSLEMDVSTKRPLSETSKSNKLAKRAASRQVKEERRVATKDNIAAKQIGVLP